jgi:hypothetical protein
MVVLILKISIIIIIMIIIICMVFSSIYLKQTMYQFYIMFAVILLLFTIVVFVFNVISFQSSAHRFSLKFLYATVRASDTTSAKFNPVFWSYCDMTHPVFAEKRSSSVFRIFQICQPLKMESRVFETSGYVKTIL